MKRRPWRERFFEKVKKTARCHLWIGYRDRVGYARFWLNGESRLAHVVIWEAANGQVPDGKEVLHACDVKHCVRLDHLSAGTHDDNIKDAARRGRIPRELSPAQVIEARKRYAAGVGATELARAFNVSFWNMRDVLRGRTFGWLKEQHD